MWLFVLSAVLPVVAMGVISFRAVNAQLEEHARERLGQLARNAGQSILQQTLLVERDLRRVRTSLTGTRSGFDPADVAHVFAALAVVETDGSTRALFGTLTPPHTLAETGRARLAEDELVLRVAGRQGPALVAGLPLRPEDPNGPTIWAELRGDSIWSSAETFVTLPSVADFCVVAGESGSLHCTSGSGRVPEAFARRSDLRSGTFPVSDGGEPLLVGYWSFYPERSFDNAPWTVLVAETSAAVYAPLGVFSTTFPLALALAVLLVVLLSNVQIRRTLQPLRALEGGTREIAEGNLDARVEVSGGDEFGSLADSFNRMASQLGLEFAQFEAIQTIGHATLEGFDRDALIVAALVELPAISGCRSAAVLHLPTDEVEPGEVKWLVGPQRVGGTQVRLTLDDRVWLLEHADYGIDPPEHAGFVEGVRKGIGPGPLIVFPHLVKGAVRGATIVEGADGTPERVQRVRQIADQVALGLADVRLVEELEDMGWGAIVALARAIDAKSQWTAGHSERVTGMALALARTMGFGEEELDVLHRGGLLHDIGKIGVPNSVLDKAGGLSTEERALVRAHPAIGVRILAPIKAFKPVLPLVLHHHERWDGTGYPDGLAGEEIHPLTRVLSVADTFDAMASARPYRGARSERAVAAEILAEAGAQFDPSVTAALERTLSERGTIYPGEISRVTA